MTGVSASDAARAAGLSETEFSALEQSGNTPGKINFPELAKLLGLNAAKLEGVAKGWVPSKKDLSPWRELRQISTAEHGTEVHCYLVWDEVTREAALFDTGWNVAAVLKIVEEEKLQLKHLFITHSHPDHIAGVAKIRRRFPKIFFAFDSSERARLQHKIAATRSHPPRQPAHHEPRNARSRGRRRDLRRRQLVRGRAVCRHRGRCDLCRLHGRCRGTRCSGETKNSRPDFNSAGGHLDLPGSRSAYHRRGRKSAQSVFLMMERDLQVASR